MIKIFDVRPRRIVSLATLAAFVAGNAFGSIGVQHAVAAAQIVPERSPKLQIDQTRIPLLRDRKQVFDIPLRVVNFATPASSTASAPDRSAPASALAIQRTRPPGRTPCTAFNDYVDLTAPRFAKERANVAKRSRLLHFRIVRPRSLDASFGRTLHRRRGRRRYYASVHGLGQRERGRVRALDAGPYR